MEKLNLSYLSVGSAKSYAFYQIPKELIDNEAFDDIDYGTKLLYALMLNRTSLSANNPDFIDDSGYVYIIYTVEQVMTDMRCSNKTAIKMLSQLENIGLIEKRRQGQGKPSIIFVKDFSSVHFKKCKKYISRSVKSTFQEVNNLHCSNTNPNQKDYNKTDSNNQSITTSENKTKEDVKDDRLMDNTYNPKITNKQIDEVVENLQIDYLKSKYPTKTKNLNEILQIIISILRSNRKEYKISDEIIYSADIKQCFLQLQYSHIEYLLNSLNNTTTQIKNIRNYLIKSLMNATATINNHYTQQVNHDLENFMFHMKN